MTGGPFHIPVLLDEALSFLLWDTTLVYVDATVGGGGHAAEICRRLTGGGRLIGLDADAEALQEARDALRPFEKKVSLLHENFRGLRAALQAAGIEGIAGLLMDLGVSSHQLDAPGRGFSFRSDAPLDMRMDRDQTRNASSVLNDSDEAALTSIFRDFGEERNSRRIVRSILARRPVRTTGELRSAVEAAVGGKFLTKTLARVFQALRIAVNGELENLRTGLADGIDLLAPGGRLVVISYHSLEDRIVKEFIRGEAAAHTPSGHKYLPDLPRSPRLRVLTGKPVKPGDAELAANPRSRSAKLRAAERIKEG